MSTAIVLPSRRLTRTQLLALAASAVLLPWTASAQVAPVDDSWLAPTNLGDTPITGDYSNPSLWSLGVSPSSSATPPQRALNNTGGTINITTPVTPQMIWLGSALGTVGYINMTAGSVSTSTVLVTGDPGSPYGGEIRIGGSTGGISGAGAFYQSGGTVTVPNDTSINIGYGTASEAVYLLSGNASISISSTAPVNGGFVVVGNTGSGYMKQTDSSSILARTLDIGRNGGTGVFELHSGTVETYLDTYVGGGINAVSNSGTGTLFQNGGTLTTHRDILVAVSDGANGTFNLAAGTVKVDGTTPTSAIPTISATGMLVIGNSLGGTGTFNMTGGTVTTSSLFNIARTNGSAGVANISGGTLSSGNDIVVGGQGGLAANGTLNLSGGTLTTSTNLNVGLGATATTGSTGLFNLSGGLLTINGTVAAIGNGGGIATGTGSSGSVVQTGGTLSGANVLLDIGRSSANGSYSLSGGLLTVKNLNLAATAGRTKFFNFNGGTLVVSGVTYAGTLTNNGGILSPGTAGTDGSLTIGTTAFAASSNYSQTSKGILSIQLASASSFDKLTFAAGDTASLAGIITLNTSFSPTAGNTFNIITGGTITDTSTLIDNSAAPVSFTKSSTSSAVTLTAVAAPTWTGTGTTDWSTSTNWSTNTIPNAANAKAYLGTTASPAAVNLSSSQTVGNLTLDNSSGYTLTGSTLTFDEPVLTATAALNSAAGSHTLQNPLALNKTTIVSVTNSLSLTGGISGTGGLTKTGAGTLLLSNTNSYSGPTTLTAGTLTASSNNSFPSSSALTINSSATLDTNSTTQSIGSLAGSGTVLLSGSLTAGADNSSSTFTGSLNGTGSLTKTGTGTLSLTGISSFSSAAVSQGNLSGSTINLPNSISVSSAATLTFNQDPDSTFSGTLTGSGNLIKTGIGTLLLSGTDSLTGTTTLAAGALVATPSPSSALIFNGGTLQLISSPANVARPILLVSTGTLDTNGNNLTFSSTVSGNGSLTKAGAGTLTLIGPTNTGSLIVTAGTLAVPNAGALGTGPLTLDGGTLQTNSSFSDSRNLSILPFGGTLNTNSHNLTLSGIISGSGSLTKTGTGLLALSGTNTFAGATNVFAGTLRLDSPSASSSANAVNISSSSTLDINNQTTTLKQITGPGSILLGTTGALTASVTGTTITYSGTLSGSGSLTKAGSGTWTLAGANTFSGPVSVTAGILSTFADNNLGPSSNTLTLDNGTFRDTTGYSSSRPVVLNAGGGTFSIATPITTAHTHTGSITGPGSLTKSSTGSLIISQLNIGGTLNVTGGAMQFAPSSGTLSTGNLALSIGKPLDITNNSLLISAADTTPIDTLRDYLAAAYNSGSWNGTSTTTGLLTSSSAALDPNHTHAIGYASGADLSSTFSSYNSLPASPSSLIATYTVYGDANLNGVIDPDDYALLDRSYAKYSQGSLTNPHWTTGDFNYDGTIDANDYLLIDTSFGQAQGLSPGFLSQRQSQFGDAYVQNLIASVPEPTSLLTACGFALPLLTRRRRLTTTP